MSNFDSKDFGERLRNYRIQKGLSQENIATSLGKNKATVSRYEKGEILPDVRYWKYMKQTYMEMIQIEPHNIINREILLARINYMCTLMHIIIEPRNLHLINMYYSWSKSKVFVRQSL